MMSGPGHVNGNGWTAADAVRTSNTNINGVNGSNGSSSLRARGYSLSIADGSTGPPSAGPGTGGQRVNGAPLQRRLSDIVVDRSSSASGSSTARGLALRSDALAGRSSPSTSSSAATFASPTVFTRRFKAAGVMHEDYAQQDDSRIGNGSLPYQASPSALQHATFLGGGEPLGNSDDAFASSVTISPTRQRTETSSTSASSTSPHRTGPIIPERRDSGRFSYLQRAQATDNRQNGHAWSDSVRASSSSKAYPSAFPFQPSRRRKGSLLHAWWRSLANLLHSPPIRPRTLAFALVMLLFCYCVLPRRPVVPAIEVSSDLQDRESEPPAVLPSRKWWQPLHRDREAELTQIKKPRPKQTSYILPRHTYKELQSIPSRYTSASVNSSEGHTSAQSFKMPSVTAIIDCLSHNDIFSADASASISAMVRELRAQSVTPDAVRILAPHKPPSGSQNDFAGPPGWASVLAIPDGADPLSFIKAIQPASHLSLILGCPSGRSSLMFGTGTVELLVRAAGNDAYSNRIITNAGFAFSPWHDSRQPSPLVSWTAGPASAEGAEEATSARHVERTQTIDIPFGLSLLQTSWLSIDRIDDAEEADLGPLALLPEFGLSAYIATLLRRKAGIRALALPVAPELSVPPESLVSVAARYDSLALEALVKVSSPDDQDKIGATPIGGAARIAVYLTDEQADNSDWEDLICGFAKEAVFGHEVRVFLPTGSASPNIGSMLGRCPEVLYRRLDTLQQQDWMPNICLRGTLPGASGGTRDCVAITLPEEDVRHASWMSALPLESLQNWHTPQFDLVVITNNRPLSLHRLLSSLRASHYLGDRVNLFVSMEQTADRTTSSMLHDASWPYGQFTLRHRVVLGGLLPAIVESWYPSNNHSYGVLLEDDVEVSPLFYSWLKFSILYYRYGPASVRERAKRLFGISLYQPKNIELRPEGRKRFDTHQIFQDLGVPASMPYLSQIPCSWGAAYFPEHWREFHQFLSLRLAESALDITDYIVPDIRSNRWPKSWKRYIIELVYLRGYSMLYPNYEGFRSLSTNHLELGTHVKDDAAAQRRREAFKVPLLREDDSVLEGLPHDTLPPWTMMPIIDFWGSIVTEAEIVARAEATKEELALCAIDKEGDTGAWSLSDELSFDAADLLCQRDDNLDTYAQERITLAEREALLAEREARLAEEEGEEGVERRTEG